VDRRAAAGRRAEGASVLGPREAALIAAAVGGDEGAFRSLTEPYVRELHVHCYRLLGSVHDAEDLVQETLLRAWRRLGTFEGRASFRAWLYRIATNACLNVLARRPRQAAVVAYGPPTPSGGPLLPPSLEIAHLEPYPDRLLDEAPDALADPAARFAEREGIELAFLAAIQHLPPRQRAVLILRDVLGWAASETAALLGTSVAAVNSALQRARATIDREFPGGFGDAGPPTPAETERSLLRRYTDAWERADIDALVSLLEQEAVMTMPPTPTWFRGRDAIGAFFASRPADGQGIETLRLLETRANRRPALAAYRRDPETGRHLPYGMMVLRIERDAIAEITGFLVPELFPLFGLPAEL
jgi:RNA polymerase sigma-70 factor (ECF subfamily)